MKVKNMLSMTLFFVMALLVQGCSDDDKGGKVTGLSVTRNGIAIDSLALTMSPSNTMLAVVTDGDWSVSVPESDTTWLKVTPHEGYGYEYNDTSATNVSSYFRVSVPKNSIGNRSSQITVRAGSLTKVITISQTGVAQDAGDPFESAFGMVENLKVGYNLGNNLDSNPGTEDWWMQKINGLSGAELADAYETSWGQPKITQTMIDSITAKGFNIIRVPVTWRPHMDADNKIDEAWMDRVEEVVNYVLKDSAYCIINVMHDTGSGAWLYADATDYAQQTVKYQAIWHQVAERFKDYGDKLIFESFNEILNKQYSWTAPANGDGAYKTINQLQQDFVNTVRSTGGNNEWRNLAITTYAATGNSSTNGDPLSQLIVPADIHPSHIYLTIHSYDPYNFCNYNAGKNQDGSEYDYNIWNWNSDCEATVDKVITRCQTRADELGIPFIFGEFGAIDDNKAMDERLKYTNYVASSLKAHHTTGLWWMGLFDKSTLTWTEPRIVNALMNNLNK